MGIDNRSLALIRTAVTSIGKPEEHVALCEYGNQHLYAGAGRGPFKRVFKGIHVSLDLNSEDGAFARDLTVPCSSWEPLPVNVFDIVTNFGTTEHCAEQRMPLENMHELCRMNGIMIHAVPLRGHWLGHGQYQYAAEFFTALAGCNGYGILESGIWTQIPRQHLVYAVLRKQLSGSFVFEGLSQYLFRDTSATLDHNNLIRAADHGDVSRSI